MKAKQTFSEFENINTITKTLRIKLLPQGNTQETIQTKGLIESDRIRNHDYGCIKVAADSYYRHLIRERLTPIKIDWAKLAHAYENWLSNKTNENTEERNMSERQLLEVQAEFRTLILDILKGNFDPSGNKYDSETIKDNQKIYDGLFKKALVSDLLPPFLERKIQSSDPQTKEILLKQQEALKSYERFTTRLTPFWITRKNIFTDEDIATSLTFRLVNENFPIFLNNISIFVEHREKQYFALFSDAYNYLEGELKAHKILSENQEISDYFEINGYNLICVQSGIEQYRAILGGFVKENGEKVKGLNELLNLSQQKINKNRQEGENKIRIKQFTKLKKQILEENSTSSFIFDQIEDDADLYNRLSLFHEIMQSSFDSERSVVDAISGLPEQLHAAIPEELWVNVKHINQISHRLTGQWNILQQGVVFMAEQEQSNPKAEQNERLQSYYREFQEGINFSEKRTPIYLNLHELEWALQHSEIDDAKKQEVSIIDFWTKSKVNVSQETQEAYAKIQVLEENQASLLGNSKAIELIKRYLDCWQNEYFHWYMLTVDSNKFNGMLDDSFYPQFCSVMEYLSLIVNLYNLTRNYLTRKPSNKKKFRLNFNNPTLADGWSENKVTENHCIILRKNGYYYLAILHETQSRQDLLQHESKDKEVYERLVYNYFPDASKMIPKCSFTKPVKAHFLDGQTDDFLLDSKFVKPLSISKELFDLHHVLVNDKKRYQKDYLRQTGDEKGYRVALEMWIAFCQDFLKQYEGTSLFDFSGLKSPDFYNDLNEFYQDVDACTYKMEFTPVDAKWLDSLVENGDALLFQLYNKDFSPYSKGKPNLHTLYWLALFSQENLEQSYIKLNGMATLFYREAQIKDPVYHRKGSVLLNRYDANGDPIRNENYQELYQYFNSKKDKSSLSADSLSLLNAGLLVTKIAEHDIIKNKRYTEDQIFLHVPLSFNWKQSAGDKVNDLANRYILENENQHVIGIDRGERHLLYYSVLDGKGNIVEQGSLNSITHELPNDSRKHVSYHAILKQRENDRKEARVKWQSIDQIKDLKEGYLGHIVHKLSELIVKYKAFVILEDLNTGFKRGRFKVERQVYQKFEMALMNKLSALTTKNLPIDELGGILRPLQLCNPVQTYQDLKGQNGILFYVMSSYTSVVDPTTGFANLFNFNRIRRSNREDFISRFEKLHYDPKTESFIFTFDYNNFDKYARLLKLPTKVWEVSTRGDRISYQRNNHKYIVEQPTEIIRSALNKYEIQYKNVDDLLTTIFSLEGIEKENIIREIIYALILSLRLRNSDQEVDYILSPVPNKFGTYFDSRYAEANLPQNADANGAYLIARKGQLTFDLMRQANKEGKRPRKVKNIDWFDYLYQL